MNLERPSNVGHKIKPSKSKSVITQMISELINKTAQKTKLLPKSSFLYIFMWCIYNYIYTYIIICVSMCLCAFTYTCTYVFWSSENVGTIDILTKYQHLKCCTIITRIKYKLRLPMITHTHKHTHTYSLTNLYIWKLGNIYECLLVCKTLACVGVWIHWW